MAKKKIPDHELVRERAAGSCASCQYGYFDPDNTRWLCSCRDSDRFGMAVSPGDTCKEWEQ